MLDRLSKSRLQHPVGKVLTFGVLQCQRIDAARGTAKPEVKKMGYLAGQGFHGRPNLSKALGVGIPDNRDHQAIGGLHGYADVNVVVLPNEVAVPRGVDSRHLLQCLQAHGIFKVVNEIRSHGHSTVQLTFSQ